jgi:predicted amidohydrolase
VKLAIYQPDASPLTLEQRLRSLGTALQKNKSHKTDLVMCPELFVSGYGNAERIRQLACPLNGEAIQPLAAIARQHGVAIACGYPEQTGDDLYNSVLCLSSEGNVLANHRKRVLSTPYEQRLFKRAQNMTLFDLENGWRVALLICYEVEFPEAVRACALAGAQLVLVPTALGRDWRVVSRQLVPTRAFENGVYLAYANFAGEDESNQYIGDSVIVSPMGEDLARAGQKADYICAQINKKAIDRARERLPYLNDYPEVS